MRRGQHVLRSKQQRMEPDGSFCRDTALAQRLLLPAHHEWSSRFHRPAHRNPWRRMRWQLWGRRHAGGGDLRRWRLRGGFRQLGHRRIEPESVHQRRRAGPREGGLQESDLRRERRHCDRGERATSRGKKLPRTPIFFPFVAVRTCEYTSHARAKRRQPLVFVHFIVPSQSLFGASRSTLGIHCTAGDVSRANRARSCARPGPPQKDPRARVGARDWATRFSCSRAMGRSHPWRR
jgi:hypothetical protein